MKRLPAIIAALLLFPLLSSGQDLKLKKIMIFPFKAITKESE